MTAWRPISDDNAWEFWVEPVSNDLDKQSGEKTPERQTSGKKSRDPMVGTTLDDRFYIEEVLGQGGMSVVYKATQLRVNRHVAIKTMKVQIDDDEVQRERFQREISTLCTLNHPNIVTVYDCLIGPDDQPCVVMDYLRGASLETLIKKQGWIPLTQFARICVQICSALDHAHKRGVVHRDLKPANIVLMDNEMDFVKVVDFGLARIEHEQRRLTRSGELWGSPPYVSPEQCMGQPGDERSDVYSLGAVMFEMLTGKDPFYDAGTVYDLLQRHVGTPPPPMAHVNPVVRIPDKLEEVVQKALAKTPRSRYQTALELQEAIIDATAGALDRDSREMIAHVAAQARSKAPSPATRAQARDNAQLSGGGVDVMAPQVQNAGAEQSNIPSSRAYDPSSTPMDIVRGSQQLWAFLIGGVVAVAIGAALLWPQVQSTLAPKTNPPVTTTPAVTTTQPDTSTRPVPAGTSPSVLPANGTSSSTTASGNPTTTATPKTTPTDTGTKPAAQPAKTAPPPHRHTTHTTRTETAAKRAVRTNPTRTVSTTTSHSEPAPARTTSKKADPWAVLKKMKDE